MNNHIKEYLERYITSEVEPKFAVLIKGEWGSGKTYFIKSLIEDWKQHSTYQKSTKGYSEDEILMKPLYISLNGLSSTKEIDQRIREKIYPILYSDQAKILKKIGEGFLKTSLTMDIDLDMDGKADGKFSSKIDFLGIFRNEDFKTNGNKVLIFDDLERCTIDIKILFGYLNNFVENSKCYLILIGDEEKLSSEEDYSEINEKLIGQHFKINTDISYAIESHIKKLDNDILSSRRELIEEIIFTWDKKNLRIVNQLFFNLDLFTNLFDFSGFKHDKLSDFIDSIVFYFMIVFLEHKIGEVDIVEMDSKFSQYVLGEAFKTKRKSEERNGTNDQLDKYNKLRVEKGILSSFETIPIKIISEHVINNCLSKESADVVYPYPFSDSN